MNQRFLILASVLSMMASPLLALTSKDIHVSVQTNKGACDNQAFGWQGLVGRRAKQKVRFHMSLENLTPGLKYRAKVYMVNRRFNDSKKQILIRNKRFKSTGSSYSMALKTSVSGLPLTRMIDAVTVIVKITSGSDLSVVKSGRFLVFKPDISMVVKRAEGACMISLPSTPVTGIIDNYSSDALKSVNFEHLEKVSESDKISGKDSGLMLSVSCWDLFSGCQSLSEIVNFNGPTGINGDYGNDGASLSFGGSYYKQRYYRQSSVGKQDSKTSFRWRLRPTEAGIVFKQVYRLRGSADVYKLDVCGNPTLVQQNKAIETVLSSYDLVLVDESKIKDAKSLQRIGREQMPARNTCQ